jgi:hypothetical protein
MAFSKCLSCGHKYFEVKESEPSGSQFKIWLVQCKGCGGVVGALEYEPAAELVRSLARKLNVDLDR